MPSNLTESLWLLPEDSHQATDRSSSCSYPIPAPNLQTFPSDSRQPSCRSMQADRALCGHLCHVLTQHSSACIFTSSEVSTQITYTKATCVLTEGFYCRTPVRSKIKREDCSEPQGMENRSGSWPVAARTAGVKDKPGLAVLLVRDPIYAVPESISVVCHRVEAIGLVSTEARAPTSAPTSTSTSAPAPAPTGGRKSCWCNGRRGGSATWNDTRAD